MDKPKIGLLPLYLELYDKCSPEKRQQMESFISRITIQFEKRGIEVIKGIVCRLEKEFSEAVSSFENANVDAIVTLHLAYSPSLESVNVLTKTKLPVIVLDTTPDYTFGPEEDPKKIMYNHGIHGVQDMCNLLLRNHRPFFLEAGHWKKSDVLMRTVKWVNAAHMATKIRSCRVGIIGQPFKGMGDFAVPFNVIHDTIGIEVIHWKPGNIKKFLPDENDPDITKELKKDNESFLCNTVESKVHKRTIRAGLAIRRWIEKENLSAFTMNFLNFDSSSGFPTVPFLEASKSMARGLGYAGEGDVLTASLVVALISYFPETTFIEIFCPDWKGNRLFLSHMGEMNLNLTDRKPRLIEKPFPYTNIENPAVAVGRFKPGKAVLVNLAPRSNNTYALIIAPVTVCTLTGTGKVTKDTMTDTIRGWIKPNMSIDDFLSAYSCNGGTHHLAMVYGDTAGILSKFAQIMGWKVVKI